MASRTPEDPGHESAEARPHRPPLLRRAWIAWVVALLVAAGSAGAILFLRSEVDALRKDVADARAPLSELRSGVEGEQASIAQDRETMSSLSEALGVCIRAIRQGRELTSVWIDHLAAARDRNFERAEELFRRTRAVRRKANRLAERCEQEARDEGIL